MEYQVGTDAQNNPVVYTLTLNSGSLVVTDAQNNTILRTKGNPLTHANPTGFVDLNEALAWFQTTSYSFYEANTGEQDGDN